MPQPNESNNNLQFLAFLNAIQKYWKDLEDSNWKEKQKMEVLTIDLQDP